MIFLVSLKINNKYYETYLMKLLLNQRHRAKKGNGKKTPYILFVNFTA